jgi:hypothetical protein
MHLMHKRQSEKYCSFREIEMSLDRLKEESERRCAICGRAIQAHESRVSMAMDGVAHVICADGEAARAWVWRRRVALIHGLFIVFVIAMLWHLYGVTIGILIATAFWIAFHAIIHRRWWYYARQDLFFRRRLDSNRHDRG